MYGNKDDVKGLTFRLKMAIFVEPLILLQMAIQQLWTLKSIPIFRATLKPDNTTYV